MNEKIKAFRLERKHLLSPVGEAEYPALYLDLQPGQSEFWHGFGIPPALSFRTGFDDSEFNRLRQLDRALIKGRFAGGNVG